jgi:SAM-dependent methyltransferase
MVSIKMSSVHSFVNEEFYKEVFPFWNQAEDYFWAGFWDLYPYLDECFRDIDCPRVLDVGCANGRWFNFLEFCFPEKNFVKVGIDFVDEFKMVNNFEFKKMDISDFSKNSPFDLFLNSEHNQQNFVGFDLVTCFGVYHHIQFKETRLEITKSLAKLLKSKDSGFVLTRWNFLLLERLRAHVLKPEQVKHLLDLSQWEKGDYFLKWDKGISGIRYANMLDIFEIKSMLQKSGLKCYQSYQADDKNENRNSYYLCKLL